MRTFVAFGIVMAVLMAVGIVTAQVLLESPTRDLFRRPVEGARDPHPSVVWREAPTPTVAPRTPAGEV